MQAQLQLAEFNGHAMYCRSVCSKLLLGPYVVSIPIRNHISYKSYSYKYVYRLYGVWKAVHTTLCLIYDSNYLERWQTASVPVHTTDNVEFVACAMWELAIDFVERTFDW